MTPTPESKLAALPRKIREAVDEVRKARAAEARVLGSLSTSLLSWGMANEPGKPKRRAREATERAVAAVHRASKALAP